MAVSAATSRWIRTWPGSIFLFSVATIGEFAALSGWYVFQHFSMASVVSVVAREARACLHELSLDSVGDVIARVEQAIFEGDLLSLGEFLHTEQPILAAFILWAGFLVERSVVVLWLHVPKKVFTPAGNLRPRWLVIGGVTLAEIGVWIGWLWLAEGGEPVFAAALLVVGIHLVHTYEVALLKHRALLAVVREPGVILLTLLESGGGVWALSLARQGRIVKPLGVMFVALLVEHIFQVTALKKEADAGAPQAITG